MLKIIGTGKQVPKKILRNTNLESMVDTSDEWITSRTGIKQRYIVEDENCVDLAIEAADKAIKDSGIEKNNIKVIVVATFTATYQTPSIACLIQKALNIDGNEVIAFDLNAACSGFVYGLEVVGKLLSDNNYGLLIGAEVISKIVDWQDRNTCVLFGDGAGAVVLSKEVGVDAFTSMSDGDNQSLVCLSSQLANQSQPSYLEMDGKAIFKFAVKTIKTSIEKLLLQSKLSFDDIDYVVTHQANQRIIQYVSKQYQQGKEKFFMNLDRYGNTSAASIPIVLDEMNHLNLLKKGMKLILVGFGGGLTSGAILLTW